MGTTYQGAEQALVDQYVINRLAAHAADLDAVANGLSSRIFNGYAPYGTPYPFIIFQCQSPPSDVRGVGVTRVMVSTLYIVKAVAQVDSYSTLVPVARVIDNAMTTADTVTVSDGLVFGSVRQDQFSLIEVDEGKQFRHFGGQYTIQAQA